MIASRTFAARSAPVLAWLFLLLAILAPRTAEAGRLNIDRPGQREFVVDHAGILDAAAEREIRGIAEDLLDEHATPIVVITIESMAAHGGERMDIETFARILFDEWGVGHLVINDEQWDTGILLVISEHDRVARIELGAGWGHAKDDEAQRIMTRRIVPAFRAGDYSRGAVDGVWALDAMARQKPLPPAKRSIDWYGYLWMAVGIVLLIFVIKSLIASGRDGWGWKLILLVFTILGGILMVLAFLSRTRSRCSGSGRLGSFGGGRSGGGGATGSW